MRTPTDALRSFHRHIYLSLGAEWEVRLTAEEGTFNRPFARVGTVGQARLAGQSAYMAEYRLTFNVVAHPVEKETADEARIEAERVRHLLFIALRGQPALPARPKRIPLWDYAGIGAAQNVTDDPAAVTANPQLVLRPRGERDFLRADVNDEPSVDVVGDPADEMLYVVTASIPINWTFATDLPVTGPVADDLTVEFPAP